MESRLREAAIQGDVRLLNQLLQEDEFVLYRVSLISCPNYSPLHLAAMLGHGEFVKAILARNPELSLELDPRRKFSALHLAAARGHLQVVGVLLGVNPDACWVQDPEGRNPLHVAAIKGQIGVLVMLAEAMPLASRERTKRGESVLHLCVKNGQLGALKASVDALGGGGCEFLNQRDADGHTALHLAVLSKKIEIIHYLLTTGMDVNAKNANGLTAMDIVPQIPTDIKEQIENCLQGARALKAEQMQDFSRMQNNNNNTPAAGDHQLPNGITLGNNPPPRIDPSGNLNRPNQWRRIFKCLFGQDTQKLERKCKALMVVASLIMTMAFQAGLNPPGGVWQDDSLVDSKENVTKPHRAGESIMANHSLQYYELFLGLNTTAFVSSLGTILLLMSGLAFKNDVFMWLLRLVMWVTATSIAATYLVSINYVTPPDTVLWLPWFIIGVEIMAWSGLITLIILGKLVYSLSKWWVHGRKIRWPCGRENQDLEN